MRDNLNTNRSKRAQIVSLLTGIGVVQRDALLVASIAGLVAAGGLSACDGATFGLFGGAMGSTEAAITTGTKNLVCADPQDNGAAGPFTAADVGKSIDVAGAGAAGAVLSTTIAAYVSPTSVTLADNAGTTIAATSSSAAGVCVWGWPRSVASVVPARADAAGNAVQSFLDPVTGLPKSFGGGGTPAGMSQLLAADCFKTGSFSAFASMMNNAPVGSLVLAANTLAVGKILRVRVVGRMTINTAPHNLFLRFTLNGTAVDGPSISLPVGSHVFEYTCDTYCTAVGGAGNVHSLGIIRAGLAGAALISGTGQSFVAMDTTVPITMDVRAQMTAGDNITIDSATIELAGV